ncbi:MAG: 30S ribosomal protein S6 [Acidobacteria bacterium]|nr:30S ribosomal protein S6 [Acidobacteriota bacterium]
MRIYEELYILKPDVTEEEAEASIDQIRQIVAGGGGAVDKVDKWGVRKLAYRVQKYHEGYYVLLQFNSSPDAVKEIERRLRVSDSVLKFLTVRIDEKMKWLEKRKKIREKRAARRPQPAAPAPAAPTAATPMPGEPVAVEAPVAPVASE